MLSPTLLRFFFAVASCIFCVTAFTAAEYSIAAIATVEDRAEKLGEMTVNAAEYSIVSIALSGSEFEKFGKFTDLNEPNINNVGQVIFAGELDGGALGDSFEGIFIFEDGAVRMVQNTIGDFYSFVANVSINDRGDYSFVGIRDNGLRAVYRGSGESLTLISESTRDLKGHALAMNSIDDSGTVAFSVYEFGVKTIYNGDGNELKKIVDTNHASFASLATPIISSSGTILFVGQKSDSASINVSNGESIEELYKVGGAITRITGGTAINASGVVSFFGTHYGVTGIFQGDGGAVTTYVDSADFDCPVTSPDSMNASGTVVFWEGMCASGGGNLLAGSDPQKDIVIRNGDPLGGKTLTSRGSGPQINDRGQIVFLAKMGKDFGIFLATPVED